MDRLIDRPAIPQQRPECYWAGLCEDILGALAADRCDGKNVYESMHGARIPCPIRDQVLKLKHAGYPILLAKSSA